MRWLAISVLLAGLCFAQDHHPLTNNGAIWHTYSRDFKIAYVTGYLSGMDYASLNMTMGCLRIAAHNPSDGPASTMCLEYAGDFDFTDNSTEKMVSFVDDIYGDARNVEAPIYLAMRLGREQTKGMSLSEIQKELSFWRGCHADSTKCKK